MTEGIFEIKPTLTLGEFHHELAMLHVPTDTFENVTITAIVEDLVGPAITIGEYKIDVVDARAIAASLLLAADLIDPHHLEQQRLDNADDALSRYLREHPDGD